MCNPRTLFTGSKLNHKRAHYYNPLNDRFYESDSLDYKIIKARWEIYRDYIAVFVSLACFAGLIWLKIYLKEICIIL